MRALEFNSKTDNAGHLKLDVKLAHSNGKVRVIILMEDDQPEDDAQLWLTSVANNPAFDFLNDPAEDVYSVTDGQPFND